MGSNETRGRRDHGGQRRRPSRDRDARPPEPEVPRGQTQHLDLELDQGSYIVFDIETTGGNPEKNGITEIFALRYRVGKIEDTFYAMVNPQIPIPPIVRKMTGITNQMVRDAPTIDAIMPRFVEFVGGDVLVSHNTIGDIKFLRYFSQAACGQPMANYFLCTHLLVEKLVSEAPDKSLKGLSHFFELHHDGDFHRAEGDAYLTLGLFKNLIAKLTMRGIQTLAQAIRFQGDYESGQRLGWGVDQRALAAIPGGPGLLMIKDQEKRTTFVAGTEDMCREAKKLQRVQLMPKAMVKMVFACSKLDYEKTNSAFQAAMLEAVYVDKHKLRVDPSLWHHRSAKFVYLVRQGESSWLLAIGPLPAGVEAAVGPVLNGREALDFGDAVAAKLGAKVGRKGLVLNSEQAGAVRKLLAGPPSEGALGRLWGRFTRLFFGAKEPLAELSLPANLRPLLGHTGLLLVRAGQELEGHLVVGGLGGEELKTEGDPIAWLDQPRNRAVVIAKLRRALELRSQRTEPLTGVEALKVNRTVWWAYSGVRREGGHFVSMEALLGQGLPSRQDAPEIPAL